MASAGLREENASTGAQAKVTQRLAIQNTQRRHQLGVLSNTEETSNEPAAALAHNHSRDTSRNPPAGRAWETRVAINVSNRAVTPKAAMHRHTASATPVMANTA